MYESLQNNQMALRACILYEFASGKPVYKSYKRLCRRIGDDMINYVDFEFWFMRFASGKFDLDYDRSLDPKTRSLLDLPIHIIERVVNKLEFMDRLIVRKVSKNLQYIIDSWAPGFKKIYIKFDPNFVTLSFDGKSVNYSNDYNNIPDETVRKDGSEDIKRTVINENYQKLVIDDLAIVLKHPKLQLDELNVNYYKIKKNDDVIENFESMLKSLDVKIHVEKCTETIGTQHSKLTILPYLKAGTLTEIKPVIIADKEESSKALKRRMNWIMKLEQCKHAEMLTLSTNIGMDSFPIESFLECRGLEVNFIENPATNSPYANGRSMGNLTKVLLKSNVLELAVMKTNWINDSTFFKQFGDSAIEVPHCPRDRHFPIANSDEFFKIKSRGYETQIERTSNQNL